MSNRLQSCERSHSAITTSAPALRRADSSGGKSSSRLRAASAVAGAIVGLLIFSRCFFQPLSPLRSRAGVRPAAHRPVLMKDLTKGSISSHLIAMAVPMAAGMIFQTLYFFVDLYFVAKLGYAAVAGVSTAGNAMFIIMALTQVLGVGTVALIAQAVGRKDQADANLIFNQSLLIAALCGVLTLVLGFV